MIPDQVAITVLPEDLELAVKHLKEHKAVDLCTSCVIWQAIHRQQPDWQGVNVAFVRFRCRTEAGRQIHYWVDGPDTTKMGAITTVTAEQLTAQEVIDKIRASLPLTLHFTRTDQQHDEL